MLESSNDAIYPMRRAPSSQFEWREETGWGGKGRAGMLMMATASERRTALTANRRSKHDLPTPESPISKSLKR